MISADLMTDRIIRASSICTRLKDLFVGENYFDCGEQQQYSPDPEILAFAFIVRCGDGVHWYLPFDSWYYARDPSGLCPSRMSSTRFSLNVNITPAWTSNTPAGK